MLRVARRAAQLDRNSAYAHRQVGIAYSGLEDFARSVAALRRALALDPDDACTGYNLGASLVHLGNPEGRGHIERAMARVPDLREAAEQDRELQRALARL